MDPNGNLYYRSKITGQSSRQHPLDEYYQNLYLKLKMQRMMEVAGMGVPDDLRGKDMSSLTSEDLRRMRSHLAAKMEGEASVQRQSAPREVSAATTSISEALTLTTPRSTKARYGGDIAEMWGRYRGDVASRSPRRARPRRDIGEI